MGFLVSYGCFPEIILKSSERLGLRKDFFDACSMTLPLELASNPGC